MGRSTTPKYALHVRYARMATTMPICWIVQTDGPATDASVAQYLSSYNESLRPGGSNEHLMGRFGAGAVALSAELRRNCLGGETVARAQATPSGRPLFEAVA